MDERDDPPDEPLTRAEIAVGMLADEVRRLAAHVMILLTLLKQREEGVLSSDVDMPAELELTREHLMALHGRVVSLAQVFGEPSTLPPPPDDLAPGGSEPD